MGMVNEFDLEMEELEDRLVLFTVSAEPTIISRVIETQRTDSESDAIRAHLTRGDLIDRWTLR